MQTYNLNKSDRITVHTGVVQVEQLSNGSYEIRDLFRYRSYTTSVAPSLSLLKNILRQNRETEAEILSLATDEEIKLAKEEGYSVIDLVLERLNNNKHGTRIDIDQLILF